MKDAKESNTLETVMSPAAGSQKENGVFNYIDDNLDALKEQGFDLTLSADKSYYLLRITTPEQLNQAKVWASFWHGTVSCQEEHIRIDRFYDNNPNRPPQHYAAYFTNGANIHAKISDSLDNIDPYIQGITDKTITKVMADTIYQRIQSYQETLKNLSTFRVKEYNSIYQKSFTLHDDLLKICHDEWPTPENIERAKALLEEYEDSLRKLSRYNDEIKADGRISHLDAVRTQFNNFCQKSNEKSHHFPPIHLTEEDITESCEEVLILSSLQKEERKEDLRYEALFKEISVFCPPSSESATGYSPLLLTQINTYQAELLKIQTKDKEINNRMVELYFDLFNQIKKLADDYKVALKEGNTEFVQAMLDQQIEHHVAFNQDYFDHMALCSSCLWATLYNVLLWIPKKSLNLTGYL